VAQPVVEKAARTPAVNDIGEFHCLSIKPFAATGAHHIKQGRAVAGPVHAVKAPFAGKLAASSTSTNPALAPATTVSDAKALLGLLNKKFDALAGLTCWSIST
jgi:hypothetical protein